MAEGLLGAPTRIGYGVVDGYATRAGGRDRNGDRCVCVEFVSAVLDGTAVTPRVAVW